MGWARREVRVPRLLAAVAVAWGPAVALESGPAAGPRQDQAIEARAPAEAHQMFLPSSECMACHNGLTAPSGEDVSIGVAWRASMMANASRDPYWQAAVRRETLDHRTASAEIEAECAICHMPMASRVAEAGGRHPEIFAHLGRRPNPTEEDVLAIDGVSCSLCHQIGPDRLGTAESFVGGFVVAPPDPSAGRRILGPFEVDGGRTTVMRSSTGMSPTEAQHLRESELCATCHTLITTALDADGGPAGSLPEQVPYQEWQHSAWSSERSCQSCHMPVVNGQTPIASVLGEPRDGLARHTFLGGNFFVLRMLNRFRDELGVAAPAVELEAAARGTLRQLQTDTASVAITSPRVVAERLEFEVTIDNHTGHKLPTGYPSRRVWLHVTVQDGTGRTLFESGAVMPDGRIQGNDADVDAGRMEAHYEVIEGAEQVQIYESVMADQAGRPTTGLLSATEFIKDNRLLPRGFDKGTAGPDIAVRGGALEDGDFAGGRDQVRYRVAVGGGALPLAVDVELRYQPIGFRWADNLRPYDAPEPRRFVSWFDAMASDSSAVLARARATFQP